MEPPKQASSFLSLPDELIVNILRNCDVRDVFRVERTCRTLKHVCSARLLWTTILENLPIEHTPNLPPTFRFSELSTETIRRAIIKGIIAHDDWEMLARRPKMRLLEVPLTDPMVEDVAARRARGEAGDDDGGEGEGTDGPALPARRGDILVEPRLLPGRAEALVINRGRLELWHTSTKRRLWSVPTFSGDFNCFAFDFEVVEEGKKLIVASADAELGFSTLTPLRIFSYDFASDQVQLLFECNMPPVFLFRMMLRGSYVLAPVSPTGSKTMLVNWRTQKGLLLQYVDSSGTPYDTRATVLAGSVVVSVLHLPETGFSTSGLALSAIEPEMLEISTEITPNMPGDGGWHTFRIRPSTDETVARLSLPVPGRDMPHDARNSPFMLAHRVFQKPWLEGGQAAPTEILLATFDSAIVSVNASRNEPLRMLSYHINVFLAPGNDALAKPILSLVKSTCDEVPQLPWNARSLSNNGHMFSLGESIRCFSLFTTPEANRSQPVKHIMLDRDVLSPDELMPMITSVEPWSGDIAIGMPGKLLVLSFDDESEGQELMPADGYDRLPPLTS